MPSPPLEDDEIEVLRKYRAEKEAKLLKWQPRAKVFITGPEDAARYLAIYDMALRHFNGGDAERRCVDCDCENYIAQAAMELALANPGDEKKMWAEFNARHK